MANIYLTETAQFKPFTYQEMLAPVALYKEEYDKNEETLNTLLEDAATKSFSFRPGDVTEKAQYDNIISKIKDAANTMSSQGLSAKVFKDIQNINKEYRTTLIPIQKKLEKRQELINEQRKLKAENPNLVFTKNYETENLSNITNDSTYDIVNLAKIEEDVLKDYKSFIVSQGTKRGTPERVKGTNYYSISQGYGYTDKEFVTELANPNSVLHKKIKHYLSNPEYSKYGEDIQKMIHNRIINTISSNKGVFEDKLIAGAGGGGGGGPKDKPFYYKKEGDGRKYTIKFNKEYIVTEDEDGNEVYTLSPSNKDSSKKNKYIKIGTANSDEGAGNFALDVPPEDFGITDSGVMNPITIESFLGAIDTNKSKMNKEVAEKVTELVTKLGLPKETPLYRKRGESEEDDPKYMFEYWIPEDYLDYQDNGDSDNTFEPNNFDAIAEILKKYGNE